MAMANSPITQATEQPASSSPPSSSSESPITQVSQYPPNRHHTHRQGHHGYGGFPSTLYLNLRGTRFEIERDVLVSLPESILIVMFPNGLILGQPARTRPHASPPQLPLQPQAQQQEQQAQLPQGQPQQRAELPQQQVPPRSRQPTDQQQPSLLPSSSVPSQQTLGQQQQQQLQNPTAPNQGQASSPSQHHRRQSSSDSSYYDDEDYDDDYDDDYYDDEDEEGEDEEDYESEDEEEYMSMEDQVIHVDFDPSCMAFLLNVYRQAQLAGEAHRQQQIQLMLQKQRLAQAQAAQTHAQQPQQQQAQRDQQLSQDLARAQALSQSQAQTQAQTKAHAQIYSNKSNNSNTIDSYNNTLAVDQQALDLITVSDSNASPIKNDTTDTAKTTVVSRTGAGSGTTDSGTHNLSRPPASPVINGLAASSSPSSPSSPMTTSTLTSTSASISHTTPTSQPRSSSAAQQPQQNELHRLQQQQIYQNSSSSPSSSSTSSSAASSRSSVANLSTPPASNPLLNKQAIIVLREELDYFAITPPRAGFPAKDDLLATGPVLADLTGLKVKTACGQYLLEQSKIFTALQRNISKENNVAEQHLIDMLCVSGFSKDDEWGYRRMETGRTSIASLSLVMLKTAGDGNQMATAQKLLLFWRKPARKCWWDGIQIELDHNGGKVPIRLWARRTWTLELVLV
ncbi:hypothetical protein BG005_007831 [Podila minutissima]|nr:hypothetical protein BG005_007831 [Podila minutissima]